MPASRIARWIALTVTALVIVTGTATAHAAEPTPTYSVSGTVSLAGTSGGVAGASEVLAELYQSSSRIVYDLTDSSGKFTITGVRAGTYHLRFSSYRADHMSIWWNGHQEEFGPPAAKIIVSADIDGIEQLMPVAGVVTGRVSLGTEGFAGAGEVRVNYGRCYDRIACTPYDVRSVLTDADGYYEIRDLYSAYWVLSFEYIGGVDYRSVKYPSSAHVLINDSTQTFTHDVVMPRAGRVSGHIVMGGVRSATAGEVTVSSGTRSTVTDADGNYSLSGVSSGAATINVSTPSSSNYVNVSASVQVSDSLWDVTHNVTLAAGVAVSGTVTNSAGAALSGYSVRVVRDSDDSSQFPKTVATTVTAADGTYGFSKIPAGQLEVKSGGSCGIPPEPCYFERGWAADPTWSRGDTFPAAPGATFTNRDIQLLRGAAVYGNFDCDFCAAIDADKYAKIERRNPSDGSWHYAGAGTNSVRFTQLLPGDYRVSIDAGQGVASNDSRVITLAEGESVDLGWMSLIRQNFLARDKSGSIVRYALTTKGKIGSATTIATAFPAHKVILDVGDITGDGNRDLFAKSTSGDLLLFAGKATSGFEEPIVASSGWNAFKNLSAPGDIDGDGNQDLIAQSTLTNKLYLFKGTGFGTFATKKLMSSSFNFAAYPLIAGVGDMTADGRSDLIAVNPQGEAFLISSSTGRKLDERVRIDSGWKNVTQIVGAGAHLPHANRAVIAGTSTGDVFLRRGNTDRPFLAAIKLISGWSGRTLI